MQHSITLEVVAALSDRGFSLDELVVKTKELFEEQGLPGFVGLLLSLAEENLTFRLLRGTSPWRRLDPCCEQPEYELRGYADRRFRTSIGTVRMKWRRLSCRRCGKMWIPLREFLGLRPYQSKSSELEQIVAEVVSDQSYRRTSRHLRLIGEIPVPKSTAHRWVMLSDCDELEPPEDKLRFLMADGTGYKRRPNPKAGIDNQGDLRIAIGVTNTGEVMPLGAWSGVSWETIGLELGQLAARRQVDGCDNDGKLASMLISDGEPGLPENLADLTDQQQRCQWHAVRDLDTRMRREKAPIVERRRMQKHLAGIIGIPLANEDAQPVSAEDKPSIRRRMDEALKKLDLMVADLIARNYSEAARYISRARDRLFSYLRFWLRFGIISPRASSLIERLMRELARRLKRIAFGWSLGGAAKMARIILKRCTSADQWTAYWRKRLRIENNVMLIFRGATNKSCAPTLGQ